MALTQISTQGIKDGTITGTDLATNVDLVDNQKLRLGTGNDLQIYHDGTRSYIDSQSTQLRIETDALRLRSDSGETYLEADANGAVQIYHDNTKTFETTGEGVTFDTGSSSCVVRLTSNTDAITILQAFNSDFLIKAPSGGGVSILTNANESSINCISNGSVELYHDNSKRFETTSDGVSIPTDSTFLRIGAGQDLDLHHNGTNSFIRNKTGNLHIRPLVAEEGIILKPNGAVELYFDNIKRFETTGTGVEITGDLKFDSSVSGGTIRLQDGQKLFIGGGNDLQIYHDGTDSFIDNSTGNLKIISPNNVEAIKVFTDGTVNIGNNADNVQLRFGLGSDLKIFHDGTHSFISNDGGAGNLVLYGNGTNSIVGQAVAGENSFIANSNGSVVLYFDNSVKFETLTNGVHITGTTFLDDSSRDDNFKAKFGTNDDLQIYHDGSHSRIDNQTGALFLRNNTGTYNGEPIKIQPLSGEDSVVCVPNGRVELYHDDNKKFETTNTGITISGSDTTGSIVQGDFRFKKADGTQHIVYDASNSRINFADNISATFGDANDLRIFHDGSNSYFLNSTGFLNIKTTGGGAHFIDADDQFFRTAGGENLVKMIGDGAVELYHNNNKKLETTSGGIDISGDVVIDGVAGGTLTLGGSSAHTSKLVIADNAGSGNGNLLIEGGDGTDFFTINSAGNVKFVDNKKALFGTDADLEIFYDSSANSKIQSNGSLTIKHQNGDKFIHCSSNSAVELYHDGTKKLNTHPNGIFTAGIFPFADNTHSIGSGSERFNTVFATQGINTSDKNEKNTIVECDLGLSFINKLKPVSYKWNKSDGKTHYGLIAQDIEETIKSVGKNLSDFGGIYKEENESMGLAYNEIFSPLIKAVQELSAKVAALEAS